MKQLTDRAGAWARDVEVVAGPSAGRQCQALQAFAYPFTYWVGMDTDPRTTPEALAEFNRFYSTTHVHEVLSAHPGFVSVSRYELAEQDARGGEHHGPRWLAVYAARDEAAALQYIKDNERPWLHRRKYSPWPPARRKAKTVWRMLWRQMSATRPSAQSPEPESICLIGANLQPEAEGGGTCLELYRAFAHPDPPGCPRFCGVSAGDGVTVHAGDSAWRLVFRRVPAPE
ncbi:MAG: hypothetical protein JOZ87_18290 [Chloroflexi bacterium]|nr:hypothetical protein [Chloroflexota bacterium]